MYVHLEIYTHDYKLLQEAHKGPFYTIHTYTCPPNNSYALLQAKPPWRNPWESAKTWTLPETVSLIRGDSRWNVPMRSALNNFSIRWKFLSFEQFQKLRSSWTIAVFCKMSSSNVKFKGIYWHKREFRRFISKCLESLTALDKDFLLNSIITGICGNNLSVCRKATQIHKQGKGS